MKSPTLPNSSPIPACLILLSARHVDKAKPIFTVAAAAAAHAYHSWQVLLKAQAALSGLCRQQRDPLELTEA